MAKDPAKELRTAISLSKKIPLNYGYCLGIDPWEAVWVTHKRKTPSTLARQAKKDGNTSKTIYGVMKTQLNVITVTCEKAPPGRVAYNMKFFLKEFGLKYKVRLIGPDGEVLEESDADMAADGTEDEDLATEDLAAAEDDDDSGDEADDGDADDAGDAEEVEDAEDPAPAPDPDYERWVAMRGKLEPRVAAAVTGGAPRADDIERLWAALDSRAENGRAGAALAAAPTLIKLLSEKPPEPAPAAAPAQEPPAPPKLDRELVARFKAAAAALKERLAVAPDQREPLLAAFSPARSAFEAKNNADLANRLDPLEALLAAPLPAPDAEPEVTAQPEAEAPPEPPDLAALALELKTIWTRARSKTDGQLSQLQAKISADGTEEGQEVARVGLRNWAKPANQHMDSALAALEKASPKRFRIALLDTSEAISAYENFLLMHPAVEELEDNVHGVSITLTDTLGGALKQMASTVARV